MLEKFSDRARKVVMNAAIEAEKLGHNYVGTEHLLLAILREGGVASHVLQNMGVDPDRVIVAIKDVVGAAK